MIVKLLRQFAHISGILLSLLGYSKHAKISYTE